MITVHTMPRYRGWALRNHVSLVHGIHLEPELPPASVVDCHKSDHEERFGRWLMEHVHADRPNRASSR